MVDVPHETLTETPMMSGNGSERLVAKAEQSEAAALELKPRSRAPSLAIHDGRAVAPLRKGHRGLERPPFECIALVLQGGGALGAYQAGVYQALLEANLQPDWVSGISIGAINAALIAGNAPGQQLDRLHAFWDLVSTARFPVALERHWLPRDLARSFINRLQANAVALNGVAGFFTPRWPPPYFGWHAGGHQLVRHGTAAQHIGAAHRLRSHQFQRDAAQRRCRQYPHR
jgi:predicted acylesterase/phospholipase RssA